MQNWIKQIEKDKEDRRRSVSFALNLNGERDELLKGVVGDYGALKNLSISKKGSEIKEKLIAEKMKVGALIIVCLEKMSSLTKEIGEMPATNDEETIYSYEQIYPNTDEGNVGESDKASKMREYNNHSRKNSRLSAEAKYINTLISNIQDNKSYDLPARVLSELGF